MGPSPNQLAGGALGLADNVSISGSDIENSSNDEARINTLNKKRKRSMKISCELCKARKVKCDKAEPACGWCAKHDRICTYKERKRPGLRTSYEIDLEDKVNRMEAMLHHLGRQVEDHIANHDVDPRDLDSARLMFQSSSDFSRPQQRPTPASIDMISRNTPTSASGWPANDAHTEMPYSRPSDSISIRSLVDGIPELSTQSHLHTPTLTTIVDTASRPTEPELPPYDLLYTLVDLYFKHVATWSPILDRKNTFDILFGSSAVEEQDRILLHAIVAVTLRFSKDPRLTSASRKRYHNISKQKVQLYGLENPNIRALQALVILAIDILGTSNGSQGWNLLALIARNVVQLGLNLEKSVYLAAPAYPSISCLQAFGISQPNSWTENEARRRLLWMVYVLDRYTTISTSFNFTLDDAELDRPLPCSYDLFSRNEPVETKWFRWPERNETSVNIPDNIGSFAYHCEVLRILSRIHKFLKRPVDITSSPEVQNWKASYRELDNDLNAFLSQLPGDYGRISQLCHSDPASKIANWIMLHAAFVTSVIRLHSAAAYPTVCSHIFTPSNQAMQRCLAAVDSLKAIAQDVVDTNGLDLLGPPFAFSLWVSARLLLVHAAKMECEVDPKIRFFISTLEHMGEYWAVAQRYARILDRLVQEGQHGHNPEGGPAKSFTAMRRSAYDLNLLVSHRPNSVLSPTSTRATSLNELEYLDVFDFFNYPRLPPGNKFDASMSNANGLDLQGSPQVKDLGTMDYIVSNTENDWLIFRPPHE